MARNLSARVQERAEGQARFGAAPRIVAKDLASLERALVAGKILCYAQGFAMIATASEAFGWALPSPTIARIWRAGCIIRSAMLDDMAAALERDSRRNLILNPLFAERIEANEPGLRKIVAEGALNGLPTPALGAGLAWFDMARTARGTANLLQAQRDFFGAHGFLRNDGGSEAHGPWRRI